MAQPSQSNGAEHSVHMPMPAAGGGGTAGGGGGTGHGQGEVVATAERRLNCFVRCVALIERLGNALGTLAFTWATVVLLGGYPTVLRNDKNDFWFATIIFFLEAFRMFSRNNRTDYKLFFGTRGAFRLFGWRGLILIVYFNGVAFIIFGMMYGFSKKRLFVRNIIQKFSPVYILPLLGILVAVGRRFVCPGVPILLARIPLQLRRAVSVWSPVVAIIILLAPYLYQYSLSKQRAHKYPIQYLDLENFEGTVCIVYGVLLVVVLLVTVSRMRFAGVIKLANIILGRKQEFWRRLVLNLCLIGANVTAAFSFSFSSRGWFVTIIMIAVEVSTLVLVSFGNFQIPAALLRAVLPLIRLGSISKDYKTNCNQDGATPSGAACDPDRINLAPSLHIFYGMVLGQGVLYLMACVVEIFSFIPRRSLVHCGGFKGQWGVDSVDSYYSYALEKCMERNVLAPNISLCNFVISYLNSDSTKRQLHGIRTAHTLLQRDPTRTRLIVKLKASTETMTRVMRMLHRIGRDREDETIRLFSAKVIDQLAKSLLVVNCPGIVQNVSLLLDYGSQKKRGNPLLDADDEQEQNNDIVFLNTSTTSNQMEKGDEVPNSGKLLQAQQIGSNEHNSWIARRWQPVSEFCSVPKEGPLTEQDLLPVIGMSIIQSLATYDQSNCAKINKATDLIRKITRFTSFSTSDNKHTDSEKKALVQSSLKLFYRLTSIDGEMGITLRQNISKHTFLLRNLSEILGDIASNYETRKLAAGIIRNLAINATMRQAIGKIQRIIPRLMHVFLTPDEPSSSTGASVSHSREALRKVAGQALAMLAIGNVDNCLTMLRQTGYSFIEELTTMIHVERYRCVAASLLRSVCMHARSELKDTDLKQLSYISRMVLERILRAEGEELEIFIALSSHIYEAIPEEFARDFGYGQIKVTFVKRLVDALNANMEPNADCPGIKRVILEHALKLMEYDSSNVNCFRNLRMIEVLSMVEETISEAENYTIFMGDVRLMEAGEPLSLLVARAKQLLDVQ